MAKTQTWSSRKTSANSANKLLAKEIEKRRKKGYVVVSSSIVEAGRSKRSWLFLGIFNFLRGHQVQAVATFAPAPPQT